MADEEQAGPVRALVVGLGRMGGFHARVLTDLGYEVTTVDPDPARGADLAAVPPGSHFAVACVAVPIPLLSGMAVHTAERVRPEFLLVEKPFASSALEARLLERALAGGPRLNVCVGYVERFNPVVRGLIAEHQGAHLQGLAFERLNDRPSAEPRLDLWSHDLDLAMFLGEHGITYGQVHFDARGDAPCRRRAITLRAELEQRTYDLTAHTTSPLHAQWHAFLMGRTDLYAKPADAVRVLSTIESTTDLGLAA